MGMIWLTIRKATASAVNVSIVFAGTSPIYYFLGMEAWRSLCLVLFFGYNLVLRRRCLGQRIAGTFQDQPTNVAYAALYTASTATLLFWWWVPLDIALANGLFLQLPCLMIWGNTPHGLLASRRTMTQFEHDFECVGLRGQCPDCDAIDLKVNGQRVECGNCHATFFVDYCYVKREKDGVRPQQARVREVSRLDSGRYGGLTAADRGV
jgi:hypothetical protein